MYGVLGDLEDGSFICLLETDDFYLASSLNILMQTRVVPGKSDIKETYFVKRAGDAWEEIL